MYSHHQASTGDKTLFFQSQNQNNRFVHFFSCQLAFIVVSLINYFKLNYQLGTIFSGWYDLMDWIC